MLIYHAYIEMSYRPIFLCCESFEDTAMNGVPPPSGRYEDLFFYFNTRYESIKVAHTSRDEEEVDTSESGLKRKV